jgi:hypothetical protein
VAERQDEGQYRTSISTTWQPCDRGILSHARRASRGRRLGARLGTVS